MKKIESFTIDHLKLKRGVYVSRKDPVGEEVITSFDIRMKEPNNEPVLNLPELHTIEHVGATFVRSHEKWADQIVYFGPMGCCTGFYFIVKGDLSSKDIVGLVTELFEFISDFKEEIPGATDVECGNYLCQNLPMANYEAKKFLNEVLVGIKEENLVYPK
jgi:S-ribosylhomocysteine lyase